MATPTNFKAIARFGVFELDLLEQELRKNGLKLKLTGQPIKVLMMLIERSGRTVTRKEIEELLWPGQSDPDARGLNNAIQKVRDVLGDSADNPQFIETVPRRGYRFLPTVKFHAVPLGDHVANGDERSLLPQLKEIRQQLLATQALPDLARLHARLNRLMKEYATDPDSHEIQIALVHVEVAIRFAIERDPVRAAGLVFVEYLSSEDSPQIAPLEAQKISPRMKLWSAAHRAFKNTWALLSRLTKRSTKPQD